MSFSILKSFIFFAFRKVGGRMKSFFCRDIFRLLSWSINFSLSPSISRHNISPYSYLFKHFSQLTQNECLHQGYPTSALFSMTIRGHLNDIYVTNLRPKALTRFALWTAVPA